MHFKTPPGVSYPVGVLLFGFVKKHLTLSGVSSFQIGTDQLALRAAGELLKIDTRKHGGHASVTRGKDQTLAYNNIRRVYIAGPMRAI